MFLRRYLRLIIGLTLTTTVVAAALSLIVPVTYQSSFTLLPQETPPAAQFLMGSDLSPMLGDVLNVPLSSTLYEDLLISRSVLMEVIDRLNLIEAYGLAGMDSLKAYNMAIDILRSDIDVFTQRNGLTKVWVRSRTGRFPTGSDEKLAARRVADIGRNLPQALEAVQREKNTSRTRRRRIYLEEQLSETTTRLEEATQRLSDFQAQHLAIDIKEQSRVGIETAARIQDEILAREMAVGVLLKWMKVDNPEIQNLKDEIRELRKQLRELQAGANSSQIDTSGVGLKQFPSLSRQYTEYVRDVKVLENLYELLIEEFYRARMQETEDLPTIQVLDEAFVPPWKTGPIRRNVVLVAFLLSLLAGILICYAIEWWKTYPWREEDERNLRQIFARRSKT